MLAISKDSRGAGLRGVRVAPRGFPNWRWSHSRGANLRGICVATCNFSHWRWCHSRGANIRGIFVTPPDFPCRHVESPYVEETTTWTTTSGEPSFQSDIFKCTALVEKCGSIWRGPTWCRFTKDLRCQTQLRGLTRLWLERRYTGAKLPAGKFTRTTSVVKCSSCIKQELTSLPKKKWC